MKGQNQQQRKFVKNPSNVIRSSYNGNAFADVSPNEKYTLDNSHNSYLVRKSMQHNDSQNRFAAESRHNVSVNNKYSSTGGIQNQYIQSTHDKTNSMVSQSLVMKQIEQMNPFQQNQKMTNPLHQRAISDIHFINKGTVKLSTSKNSSPSAVNRMSVMGFNQKQKKNIISTISRPVNSQDLKIKHNKVNSQVNKSLEFGPRSAHNYDFLAKQGDINYGIPLSTKLTLQENSQSFLKNKKSSLSNQNTPLTGTPNKSIDFSIKSTANFQNQHNPYQLRQASVNMPSYSNPSSTNHRKIKPINKNFTYLEGNMNIPTREYLNGGQYEQNPQNSAKKFAKLYSQELEMSPNQKYQALSNIYTADLDSYRRTNQNSKRKLSKGNIKSKENSPMKKQRFNCKTPNELDLQMPTSLVIIDGGTGSGTARQDSNLGLKINLTQKNKLQQKNSNTNEFTKKMILQPENNSIKQKLSVNSLQKQQERLSQIKPSTQTLESRVLNKGIDRYKERDENSDWVNLDDFNQNDVQLVKLVNKESKTNNPILKSINIREEALALGKVPPEEIARRIGQGFYNDEIQISPRASEMLLLSSLIQEWFKKNDQPPITTTDFYRAGKMLGRGAFGKVSLGMHKLTRKLIAIKSINKEYLSEEKQKNKVMHEVSILLRMRHQSVVKLFETFETSRHILLVMELCAGGDLLNYVRKRKKLTEPCAKVIFKQLIEGLGYIHKKGILHRDIKLDNILLDGKGQVKIADFGVSKIVQKGEIMREQCGTPAFIAPEIIKDKGYEGFKADLWSAGVVLFAMLFGTVPFKANSMTDLHQLILKGKYSLKEEISKEAEDLLSKLLELNPKKRISVRETLMHEWFNDIDLNYQMFTEQELDQIRNDFTYNDPSRFNRNEKIDENEEPWDCFTELNLDSINQTLRNETTKSVILAPFNSSVSDNEEEVIKRDIVNYFKVNAEFIDKKSVIKFAARCRDQDRQYEMNNNCELDNGVYHKFVYSSNEGEEEKNRGEQMDKQSTRNRQGSLEKTFEEAKSFQGMMDRVEGAKVQQIRADIERKVQEVMESLATSLGEEFDIEESFQSDFEVQIDQCRIQTLINFGYPREYVLNSIRENDPNYCVTGYYLLGIDQNY